MTDTMTLFDVPPTHTSASVVEFFDPPMCCPTGLCGPTLDQTLLDVNEMILALQAEGLTVERYQMTGQPQAFLSNPAERIEKVPRSGRIFRSGPTITSGPRGAFRAWL